MIVIRNDTGAPYRIPQFQNKILAIGEVLTITDDEYTAIPHGMRGAGKIVSVYPNEAVAETLRTRMDYATVNGSTEMVYLGYGRQAAVDTDAVWIVKQFSYFQFGADNKIIDIQVLEGVAWSARASLPWS